MATKKISQLEAITEAEDSDVLVIVDVSEGTTNKITKGNLLLGSGHSIEMTLDPQTYQLVLKLKNAAGTELSTQSVDLPNENAVTGIEYNNKELIITKQVGEPSTVDLSPLIGGLVTESDFGTFTEALAETIQGINETIGAINVKNENQDLAIEENYKEITKLKSKVAEQEEIINQMPQVSDEGYDATLNDTIKAPFTLFSPEGHSEQETTEGYQMLDTNETINETTKNGVTYSLKDGVFSFNGTCTQSFDIFLNNKVSLSAGDYTMAAQNQSGSYTGTFGKYPCSSTNRVNIFDGGQVRGLFNRTVEENYDNVVLHFYVGSGSVFSNYKFSMTLLQGTYTTSNIPDWEKYTNGASPNPDYEQPIKSAGENVNKLPVSTLTTTTTNGIKFTNNGDGTYKLEGTATANTDFYLFYGKNIDIPLSKDFTMSFYGLVDNVTAHVWDGNWRDIFGASFNKNKISKTGNFTNASSIIVKITVANGSTVDTTIKPKMEIGTIASPYSPFGMGCLTEKIVNRNLFDYNNQGEIGSYLQGILTKISDTSFKVSGSKSYSAQRFIVKVNKGETYTIKFEASGYSDDNYSHWFIWESDDGIKQGSLRFQSAYRLSKQVTRQINTDYIFIDFSSRWGGEPAESEVTISNVQLELGSTASPYIPHEEQTYSIYTQQPMRSIGDVRDDFVKVKGNWYERHNSVRSILNGTEYIDLNSEYNNSYSFSLKEFNTIIDKSSATNILCNILKTETSNEPSTIRIATGSGNIIMCFAKDFITYDVTAFKTYLATQYSNGNPVYIDYLLATPTLLPCTPEQIDILENIPSTFSGQTNVFSEDEVKAYLRASGIYDLNNLITRVEVIESEV